MRAVRTTAGSALAAIHGPQPLDQLQGFEQARHPVAHLDAKPLELDLAVAEPDAEHAASLRHHIEAGDILGDLHRVEQRQQQHRQHQLHRAGLGREPRQQRDALQ
jgi:hypothetical protein